MPAPELVFEFGVFLVEFSTGGSFEGLDDIGDNILRCCVDE